MAQSVTIAKKIQANVTILVSDLQQANALSLKCKVSTCLNIKEFLAQSVTIAKKIQANVTILLNVSENALQRHEEEAGNVTETQQCTSLPSSDPGLRCHHLSAHVGYPAKYFSHSCGLIIFQQFSEW